MKSKTLQSLLACAAVATCATQAQAARGPSTTTDPYTGIFSGNSTIQNITSILTVGDSVNKTGGGGSYRMAGIPDGLGAYDNNNGTFTVLMTHETSPTYTFGSSTLTTPTRDHGGNGSFISEWIINKNDFSVVSGGDLMKEVKLWDSANSTWNTVTDVNVKTFSRLCSADLATPNAFYHANSGMGTTNRLFMAGEESSSTTYLINGQSIAKGIAAVATGADKGNAYILPWATTNASEVGWENLMANPNSGTKTVVMGTSDGGKNGVWMYVGQKTNSGTDVEKAGLLGGNMYRIAVGGATTNTETTGAGTNGYGIGLGTNTGNPLVKATNSFTLINSATSTNEGTKFLRPEDGAWSLTDASKFYFVTTSGVTSGGGRSRLWEMNFSDIHNDHEQGGTIKMLLDGTEGGEMFDNMTVDIDGNIILQEDPGNNARLARMWKYNTISGSLEAIMAFNQSQFLSGESNFITQDEESSGVIDITDILNKGDGSRYYLYDAQIHARVNDPGLVEGGQLMVAQAVPEPSTYALMTIAALGMLIVMRRKKIA